LICRNLIAAALAVGAALAGVGCGRPAAPLAVTMAAPTASAKAHIAVTGFSSAELRTLASLDADRWPAVLRVTVDGTPPDAPPVSGAYLVTGDEVTFTPTFPFDAGRGYAVDVDPTRLPAPRETPAFRTVVVLPAASRTPSTTVTRFMPSADVLPENLLRIYLEFSAPMSREHGRDFLTLLDEHGAVVSDAFLALDVDFWSPDGRRYTVFLDPGRVKRGILPNDQFGRALTPGHRFTLVVDRRWRDEHGQPLASEFRHTFHVGPAVMSPLNVAAWQIDAPPTGTRAPLVVSFPRPLDHGLLYRALGVARGDAPDTMLAGAIDVGPDERSWRFTPSAPWTSGTHDLVALSILEDPQGNKIGRPFDVDTFTEIDQSPVPERTTRAFNVR
jgi:hypothetical protein